MTCAKCGSDDVRVLDVDFREIGASIPVGLFSSVKLNHHVCTKCGYVESYVKDADARKKIAEKWPRTTGNMTG